jgi:hypothetical protein
MSTTPESYVISIVHLIGEYLVATRNVRDNPVQNVGAEYRNNVFFIQSYNWDDDADPEANFGFVEYGYEISWYKYLGRGDEANMPLNIFDALYMLNRCIVSIDHNEVVPIPDSALEWTDEWHVQPDDDD